MLQILYNSIFYLDFDVIERSEREDQCSVEREDGIYIDRMNRWVIL